jgi:hypothetical protein
MSVLDVTRFDRITGTWTTLRRCDSCGAEDA